jgi:hypothetical protein
MTDDRGLMTEVVSFSVYSRLLQKLPPTELVTYIGYREA